MKRRQRKSYCGHGTTRDPNHTESIILHSTEFGIPSSVFCYNQGEMDSCWSVHFTAPLKPLLSHNCLSAEYFRPQMTSNNFLCPFTPICCICQCKYRTIFSTWAHFLQENYCYVKPWYFPLKSQANQTWKVNSCISMTLNINFSYMNYSLVHYNMLWGT